MQSTLSSGTDCMSVRASQCNRREALSADCQATFPASSSITGSGKFRDEARSGITSRGYDCEWLPSRNNALISTPSAIANLTKLWTVTLTWAASIFWRWRGPSPARWESSSCVKRLSVLSSLTFRAIVFSVA